MSEASLPFEKEKKNKRKGFAEFIWHLGCKIEWAGFLVYGLSVAGRST
jgi:hypothetical protein